MNRLRIVMIAGGLLTFILGCTQPCVVDGDCAAGQVCNAEMCGPELGSKCTVNADCLTGEICVDGSCTDDKSECITDFGCPDGQACQSGQCVPETPECTTDADCGSTIKVCIDGACEYQFPDCYTDFGCPSGQVCESGECVPETPECTTGADCPSGEACVAGECELEEPECRTDSGCPSGQACQSGECVPQTPECTTNADCPTGAACVAGECKFEERECFTNADCGAGAVCNTHLNECVTEVSPHSCCESGSAGCTDPVVEACVCALDEYCCNAAWDDQCVDRVDTAGCGSCSGPTNVTLTVAFFRGLGSGTITGPGIDCGNGGSDCTEEFTSGSEVTLSAAPAADSVFSRWSGCDSTSGGDCYINMDQDRLVVVEFDRGFSMSIEIVNLPPTDNDGSYTLEWTVGGLASTHYIIEEDTDPTFSSPTRYHVYDGRQSYSFSNKRDGTYWYRVSVPIGDTQAMSAPASITVARPTAAVLRVANNTHYDMIDIQLNGYQMLGYPNAIPAGQSHDVVLAPGTVNYFLSVGFYDVHGNRDRWFNRTGSVTIYAGQTVTVTFDNPTIGQLLSNFDPSGRNWSGQYICYPCPVIAHVARFQFWYNGTWTLFDNEAQVGSGSVILTSWPDYSTYVKFKLSPTGKEITLSYPFESFKYGNGPPRWPSITYVAQ